MRIGHQWGPLLAVAVLAGCTRSAVVEESAAPARIPAVQACAARPCAHGRSATPPPFRPAGEIRAGDSRFHTGHRMSLSL
ncbi:hypothetical protein HDA32_000025 [Spinactinospora alkalitolerans]|uniref:Uncharacterized protein n=1 Tax=Spinactinospora alkalitolerans TaxID=687207 RepID=A0A852TMU6_9ACTN|nr:hypothetical protein [Spinactinospora alkalitolerans]